MVPGPNLMKIQQNLPDLTPGPNFLQAPGPRRTPGPKTHQKTKFLFKKPGFKTEFQLPRLSI